MRWQAIPNTDTGFGMNGRRKLFEVSIANRVFYAKPNEE
jgi:hypothetical protein